jgi:hypothetical protein
MNRVRSRPVTVKRNGRHFLPTNGKHFWDGGTVRAIDDAGNELLARALYSVRTGQGPYFVPDEHVHRA